MGRKEDELWIGNDAEFRIWSLRSVAHASHKSRRNKDRDLLPTCSGTLSPKAPSKPRGELLIANELQS